MQQPYLIPPMENPEPPIPEERSFHRDIGLLVRHRQWGFNMPAVDIDFLEYDERKSIALVEYKRSLDLANSKPNLADSNLQALIDLADRASLPVFCTFYSPNYNWYRAFPVNGIAEQQAPPDRVLSEYEWVDFLHWLKGRQIPEYLEQKLFGG